MLRSFGFGVFETELRKSWRQQRPACYKIVGTRGMSAAVRPRVPGVWESNTLGDQETRMLGYEKETCAELIKAHKKDRRGHFL